MHLGVKSNGSIYQEQYIQQGRSVRTTRAARNTNKSIQARGTRLNQFFGTEQVRDFHDDRTQIHIASFYRRDGCTMKLRGKPSKV